jgi:hypothetical protein
MRMRGPKAFGALLLAATGCSGSGASSSADSGTPATWTQVYADVIATRCAPCHTTQGGIGISSGMLDMTSKASAYSHLVGVSAAGSACAGRGTRVVPSMHDSSILYLKVSLDDPTPCGSKMPQGGMLTQQQADAIESWIDDGAKDN